MSIKYQAFPTVDPQSLLHCQKVSEYLQKEILKTRNQRISFADFMHKALYAPGLGYYNAGATKFGPAGDFITAPEISILFSICVAQQCAQIIQQLRKADILEFGAGTGIMAAHILLALEERKTLPNNYYILEVSPHLKQRQQQILQQYCPHLLERIRWLERLPIEPINGIILANEVLDAMPIHRFHIHREKIDEFYVTYSHNTFQWLKVPLTQEPLYHNIRSIQKKYLSDDNDYTSEFCTLHQPWLKSLSQILTKGLVLLIDYGFPAAEYYHPQRNMGTLMCHIRHHAHDNPLIYPGVQDITAHVNFTQIAEAAVANHLDVAGYTSQAHFLMNCGLGKFVDECNTQDPLKLANEIKLLTLPSEMGELFKVMALSRKISFELMGFQEFDRRQQL